MGDMAEGWEWFKARKKANRENNLNRANPEGWTVHTAYHWSRIIKGKHLDYWPSTRKFRYEGRVMTGDVNRYISRLEEQK